MSALLAVALLGEHLEWPQVLGMALILGAVGLPRLLASDEPRASGEPLPVVAEA